MMKGKLKNSQSAPGKQYFTRSNRPACLHAMSAVPPPSLQPPGHFLQVSEPPLMLSQGWVTRTGMLPTWCLREAASDSLCGFLLFKTLSEEALPETHGRIIGL